MHLKYKILVQFQGDYNPAEAFLQRAFFVLPLRNSRAIPVILDIYWEFMSQLLKVLTTWHLLSQSNPTMTPWGRCHHQPHCMEEEIEAQSEWQISPQTQKFMFVWFLSLTRWLDNLLENILAEGLVHLKTWIALNALFWDILMVNLQDEGSVIYHCICLSTYPSYW